ncbi:hypothetical protein CDCA_CDCA04G1254 [Cyanidium caldarium]|uniref:Dolichyl-diphosphooligosaccharide--protein glycosyltransferase subunit 1 n=1 Tax=Cyanidium caldarium TaxID=2771 RepID=A0AAV9ISF1_CYACA|nr:hypothetical protein CDCA_CDCA04G1254 [Cyanidium caldarium]
MLIKSGRRCSVTGRCARILSLFLLLWVTTLFGSAVSATSADLVVEQADRVYTIQSDGLARVDLTLTLSAARPPSGDWERPIHEVQLLLPAHEEERLAAFLKVEDADASQRPASAEEETRLVLQRASGDAWSGPMEPATAYRLERRYVRVQRPNRTRASLFPPTGGGEDARRSVRIRIAYLLARAACPMDKRGSASMAETLQKEQDPGKLTQTFRFFLPSAYLLSPYLVHQQTLAVRRAVASDAALLKILETPRGPAPVEQAPLQLNPAIDGTAQLSGFQVVYGPYSDREPQLAPSADAVVELTFEAPTLRSLDDIALSAMVPAGSFRALRVDRELEISAWGNVHVRDQFTLLNDYGAHATDAWSRIDFVMQQQRMPWQAHTITEAKAMLPRSARNVFFRDVTGNISSSAFRSVADLLVYDHRQQPTERAFMGDVHADVRAKLNTHQLLALRPRFPVAPGWRTHFEYGYDVYLRDWVGYGELAPGLVDLKFTLPPPLYGLTIDELQVRVILPTGASVLHVDTPDDRQHYQIRTERQQTYRLLDFQPRTVVTIRRRNAVTNYAPLLRGTASVMYGFNYWHAVAAKPLRLIVSLAALFALLIVLNQADGWSRSIVDRQRHPAQRDANAKPTSTARE